MDWASSVSTRNWLCGNVRYLLFVAKRCKSRKLAYRKSGDLGGRRVSADNTVFGPLRVLHPKTDNGCKRSIQATTGFNITNRSSIA